MITATPDDATLYIARADVEREMKHEDLALVDFGGSDPVGCCLG